MIQRGSYLSGNSSKFYRWDALLQQGRRIFVVGDLNIAPTVMDSCNPKLDFEKNEFRRWFRSILVDNGGRFFDVFRTIHPKRREAYTHWPQNTGAEEFNYGSRIDHILVAGVCLHEDYAKEGHNLVACHIKECDMIMQFKRCRPGSSPRWKGGRNVKLEGSDHVPLYMTLVDIPDIQQHNTPSLSARNAPEIRGFQQTIVSVLMKRQVAERQISENSKKMDEASSLFLEEKVAKGCSESLIRSSYGCAVSGSPVEGNLNFLNVKSGAVFQTKDKHPEGCSGGASCIETSASKCDRFNSSPGTEVGKRARKSQGTQLSLTSFFQKSSRSLCCQDNAASGMSTDNADVSKSSFCSTDTLTADEENSTPKPSDSNVLPSTQEQYDVNACLDSEKEKTNTALIEWQRIRQLMQDSIPLCKGHCEPCVARIVKKSGPNFGRRFYACARAEGPASNPETNCGYFKWAASKPKGER